MRVFLSIIFFLCVFPGCKKVEPEATPSNQPPHQFAPVPERKSAKLVQGAPQKSMVVKVPASQKPEVVIVPDPHKPPIVKCKPTWEMRSFRTWRENCISNGECAPMGRATILVEFIHRGCSEFKRFIDNQAALNRGYAPQHQFLFVVAASDALTRLIYDSGSTQESPCRVFLYDDMLKADHKVPNEDQQIVELCKGATSLSDGECRGELGDERLYIP